MELGKKITWVCDQCGATKENIRIPDEWYQLGFRHMHGLLTDWVTTHEFCSEKCIDKFMESTEKKEVCVHVDSAL